MSAAVPAHDCADAKALAQLLAQEDVDAALRAGLMDFIACPHCDSAANATLQQAQHKLRAAWAARERFRARAARLARIAAERDARRAPVIVEKKPALPPTAAAILTRAKAKAAAKSAS